jgi:hypothetical protein
MASMHNLTYFIQFYNFQASLNHRANACSCFSYEPRPRAYGVQYKHNGKYKIAHANNEVILSAGAVASPQVDQWGQYYIINS